MERLRQLIHQIHRRSLWQVLGVYVEGVMDATDRVSRSPHSAVRAGLLSLSALLASGCDTPTIGDAEAFINEVEAEYRIFDERAKWIGKTCDSLSNHFLQRTFAALNFILLLTYG